MRKLFVLLGALGLCGAIADAGSRYAYPAAGSSYDYQTGNAYNYNTDGSGNTHVRGYNALTGSTWNTDIQSNGNMRGFDSDNNYWNYNRQSNTYINYGTGRFCTGSGYSRVCTGGE